MLNRIAVVVPAHDEQELLPGCLAALRLATAEVEARVVVTVVADACADRTAEVAAAAGVGVLVVSHRNVGAARSAGFARALAAGADWLATTDADSRVPRGWFADQLARAEHADVVAGAVEVLDWSPWPTALPVAYTSRYAADVEHVHGANLSFSAAAYTAVGGFAALTSGEDVDLVRRMRLAGLRVAHPADPPVVTSARRHGRCGDGFAGHLRDLRDLLDRTPTTPGP